MDVLDAIEVILIKSAVKDLVSWKRVCKSWNSLISSPSFAKAQLKHYNDSSSNSATNKELGNVRIAMPSYCKIPNENRSYAANAWKVVGSSNGLVCLSLLEQEFIVLVNNPWTREVRQLPMAPIMPENISNDLLMSFGYDSSTDDYKVVMGIEKPNDEVVIQVLSLKSNTWKLIGHVKYYFLYGRPCIFFNGALHWIVQDCKNSKIKEKKVLLLLSFILSREEFEVMPQPKDSKYEQDLCNSLPTVGIVEDQLSIFFNDEDYPHHIWVMRSYNVEDSWKLLPNVIEMKYEVVHHIKLLEGNSPEKITMSFFCDDSKCLSRDLKYIKAHIFVPSLISPFVNSQRPSHTMNNETSVKAWSFKVVEGAVSDANIRRFIQLPSKKRTRALEKVYRREVGETENVHLQGDGETQVLFIPKVHVQENLEMKKSLQRECAEGKGRKNKRKKNKRKKNKKIRGIDIRIKKYSWF